MAITLTTAACADKKRKIDWSNSEKSEAQLRAEARKFYLEAHSILVSTQYSDAIDRFDDLSRRYPFTEYATQGEVEKVYALYRSYDSDKAIAAADRFLREHPRHPHVDYVQYLRGLINMDRETSFNSMIGVASAKGDVGSLRRAFDDFATLARKYPSSRYVADARDRMIYLRNVIAEHEVYVVEFYVNRGAYLAAAKRAVQVVADYPGSPSTYRALQLMEISYRRAGLQGQADDTRRLIAAQTPPGTAQPRFEEGKSHWWQRWFGIKSEPPTPPTPEAPPPPEAGLPGGATPSADASSKTIATGADLGGSPVSITLSPYDPSPTPDSASVPAPAATPADQPAQPAPAQP